MQHGSWIFLHAYFMTPSSSNLFADTYFIALLSSYWLLMLDMFTLCHTLYYLTKMLIMMLYMSTIEFWPTCLGEYFGLSRWLDFHRFSLISLIFIDFDWFSLIFQWFSLIFFDFHWFELFFIDFSMIFIKTRIW